MGQVVCPAPLGVERARPLRRIDLVEDGLHGVWCPRRGEPGHAHEPVGRLKGALEPLAFGLRRFGLPTAGRRLERLRLDVVEDRLQRQVQIAVGVEEVVGRLRQAKIPQALVSRRRRRGRLRDRVAVRVHDERIRLRIDAQRVNRRDPQH